MELEPHSSCTFSTPFSSPHFLSGVDSDSVSVDSGIIDKETYSYISSTNDSMSEISLSSESVLQSVSQLNSCDASPSTSTTVTLRDTQDICSSDAPMWSQPSLDLGPPLGQTLVTRRPRPEVTTHESHLFALPGPCEARSSEQQNTAVQQPATDLSESIYVFETDHVALKGNSDYQNLLRVVALLEAQRTKAIKDLDKLIDGEKESLSNPLEFVQKLQSGQVVDLPGPQQVARVTDIDWSKYTLSNEAFDFGKHKHMTRKKKTVDLASLGLERAPSPAVLSDSSGSSSKALIRGRVKEENKPGSFNQLWSSEEQKRLEDLLVIYPPEEVEAKRWSKIAQALGNRTTQQVASRVQKYFIKLAKAGLPIPGRIPNTASYNRKGTYHRHQRNNRFYYASSTFLQSYEPPVYMSDDDDDTRSMDWDGAASQSQPDEDDIIVSDEEDVPLELRHTEDYRKLMSLKRLKRQKERYQTSKHHTGFKCDRCDVDPIVGTRWHCADCPTDFSVDFCEECVDSQYENAMHDSSHRLEAVRLQHRDRDYDTSSFMHGGDYNYLDPNYMPAS